MRGKLGRVIVHQLEFFNIAPFMRSVASHSSGPLEVLVYARSHRGCEAKIFPVAMLHQSAESNLLAA